MGPAAALLQIPTIRIPHTMGPIIGCGRLQLAETRSNSDIQDTVPHGAGSSRERFSVNWPIAGSYHDTLLDGLTPLRFPPLFSPVRASELCPELLVSLCAKSSSVCITRQQNYKKTAAVGFYTW